MPPNVPLSQPPSLARWRAALSQSAHAALPARWHATLAALEAARAEYGRLYAAVVTDVHAVRKAAQRVHGLEQLRVVLAHEMMNSR